MLDTGLCHNAVMRYFPAEPRQAFKVLNLVAIHDRINTKEQLHLVSAEKTRQNCPLIMFNSSAAIYNSLVAAHRSGAQTARTSATDEDIDPESQVT
jgi:hypothetical protein